MPCATHCYYCHYHLLLFLLILLLVTIIIIIIIIITTFVGVVVVIVIVVLITAYCFLLNYTTHVLLTFFKGSLSFLSSEHSFLLNLISSQPLSSQPLPPSVSLPPSLPPSLSISSCQVIRTVKEVSFSHFSLSNNGESHRNLTPEV